MRVMAYRPPAKEQVPGDGRTWGALDHHLRKFGMTLTQLTVDTLGLDSIACLSETACDLCGASATKSSALAKARGHNKLALCEKHKGRRCLPVPCHECGAPSTEDSSRRARKFGTRAVCAKHKRVAPPCAPCHVCRKPATPKSSRSAKARSGNAYCERHSPKNRPVVVRGCKVCGRPGTKLSSSGFNGTTRRNVYCEKHKGGTASEPLAKCKICRKPCSRRATNMFKDKGHGPYCDGHKGGPPIPPRLHACAVCKKPATRMSSKTARLRGHRAFCWRHSGGKGARVPPGRRAWATRQSIYGEAGSSRSSWATRRALYGPLGHAAPRAD